MKVQRILPLLVVGLIGTGVQAEDLDIGLKFRGVMGTKSDAGVRNGLAVGLGVSIPFPMVKAAKLNAELGYRYYAGDGAREFVPANSFGSDTSTSTNFQKLLVQGFYARATFGMPLAENLSWHAGLEIASLKSRMDAVGDIRAAGAGGAQVGSWTFNPEEKGFAVSPVAGVAYSFNTAGSLELNLLLAGYKQVTLTPTEDPAGTGTARVIPVLGSKNVSSLKIELAYSFRF